MRDRFITESDSRRSAGVDCAEESLADSGRRNLRIRVRRVDPVHMEPAEDARRSPQPLQQALRPEASRQWLDQLSDRLGGNGLAGQTPSAASRQ